MIKIKLLFYCLFSFCTSLTTIEGASQLWTKEIEGANFDIILGKDGSVALANFDMSPITVYWYGKSGELIGEFEPAALDAIYGFGYISEHDLIIRGWVDNDYATDLYEKKDSDPLAHTRIPNAVASSGSNIVALAPPFF